VESGPTSCKVSVDKYILMHIYIKIITCCIINYMTMNVVDACCSRSESIRQTPHNQIMMSEQTFGVWVFLWYVASCSHLSVRYTLMSKDWHVAYNNKM